MLRPGRRLRRDPAALPAVRPALPRVHPLPAGADSTRGFGPLQVGDNWGPDPPLRLWRATKLSVTVTVNPVYVRLSRTAPPYPPEWDDPIAIPLGFWAHAGRFGYFQFKNQVAGAAGTVNGAAYSE
jgi:hypothetical protein